MVVIVILFLSTRYHIKLTADKISLSLLTPKPISFREREIFNKRIGKFY